MVKIECKIIHTYILKTIHHERTANKSQDYLTAEVDLKRLHIDLQLSFAFVKPHKIRTTTIFVEYVCYKR